MDKYSTDSQFTTILLSRYWWKHNMVLNGWHAFGFDILSAAASTPLWCLENVLVWKILQILCPSTPFWCVNSHKNHSSITLTEDQQRDSIYKLINFNQQQGRQQQQRIWRQRQGVPFLLTPDTQYDKIKNKIFLWLILFGCYVLYFVLV